MTASAGSERLKVLFFSQRFPFPMDTGGKIRTGKILEQLKDVFEITLVSNVESPKDDEYLDQVKTLCSQFYPVPWKEANKFTFKFYLKLLRSLFSYYPFTVISDYSADIDAALRRLTSEKRFDLWVCDFLQPSLNFRRLSGVPTLLFEHNVETVIPRRHFETSQDPIAKIFWWLQWRRMERYEREACRTFSGTVTVSERDKTCLKEFGIENVFTIPTGVDTDYFAPREDRVKNNSLVFTGSMDWLPNEDAIQFFIRDIFPRVKQQMPDVSLTVVGRNPSRRLLNEIKCHPEVTVTGRVEDVRPYISSHTLYIIPLRIGGGTRIKAYEAMAMGKAIISTQVGVEGLPVRHGEQLIIADEPEQFAFHIVRLFGDAAARAKLETCARSLVQRHFGWEAVAASFADICRHVVQLGPGEQCQI
jgi:glycosyltransferase involved in cell wall biosynthesis